MRVFYTLEKSETNKNSIFLAGPTYRIYDNVECKHLESWRKVALKYLENLGFEGDVYVPEWKDNVKPLEWTYSRQVDWETEHLKKCGVILFWIPRDLNNLPAFTTNIEFGEWLNSGKIVIGSPVDAPKNKYLIERCSRLGVAWFNMLEALVSEAVEKLNSLSNPVSKVWFTADTHFSEKRTLELSKRPFKSVEEMDWTMVKNWNERVTNNDIVYHLGDFGNPEMIKHLNGKKIYLLPGNYDTPDIVDRLLTDKKANVIGILSNHKYVFSGNEYVVLIHKPEDGNAGAYVPEYDSDVFYLFGHVHKLQMVKQNGLNVGVDCHNFCPIDIETVLFYKNAIEKHYDKNVFMERLGG
jgi:calcineurin-like phosphoesterase family protein